MLNPERRNGERRTTIRVKDWSTRASMFSIAIRTFDLTHEKSMVVDDETAFVQSFNWEPQEPYRDARLCLVTAHKHEVDEIAGVLRR